jgi:hypothetical protein
MLIRTLTLVERNEARDGRVRQDQQSPSGPTAARDTAETCRKTDELLRRSGNVQRISAYRIPSSEGACHSRHLGQGEARPVLLLPGKVRGLGGLRNGAAATLGRGSYCGCSKAEITAYIDAHQYVYMITAHTDGHVRIFRASRIITPDSRARISQELPVFHPREERPS